MIRVIKFRLWDRKHESFVNEPYHAISLLGSIQIEGHTSVEPMRYVIQQFTGLVDKHGKDMYEGDILLVYGERRVVEFRTAWWGVQEPEKYWKEYASETTWAMPAGFGTPQPDSDQFKPLYRYDSPEVIGNIYENPELLKEKEHGR